MDPGARPIIIVKKKSGHGGHHGGAWKVAYADFVTAMMALSIVLWLMSVNKPVQEAIGGYFRDPSGTSDKKGTTLNGTGPSPGTGPPESFPLTKDNMPKLKEELQNAVQQVKGFEKFKDQVEMTVTSEGLRVDLLETSSGTFFDSGSPKPNDKGRELLTMLAQELGKLPNKVNIEGHTDSKPYAGGETMAIGSYQSIAPTPQGGLCSKLGSEVTRFPRCAASQIRSCTNPIILSTLRTGVSA
jgi:chemotaxis protein MotB